MGAMQFPRSSAVLFPFGQTNHRIPNSQELVKFLTRQDWLFGTVADQVVGGLSLCLRFTAAKNKATIRDASKH